MWHMHFICLTAVKVATFTVSNREAINRPLANLGLRHSRCNPGGPVVKECPVIQNTLTVVGELITQPGKGRIPLAVLEEIDALLPRAH